MNRAQYNPAVAGILLTAPRSSWSRAKQSPRFPRDSQPLFAEAYFPDVELLFSDGS